MAVTHSDAARDVRNDALNTFISTNGTTNPNARCVLMDDTTDVLVFELEDEAFDPSDAGVMPLDTGVSGIPAEAIAAGVVDHVEIRDLDEGPHVFASVGGVGSGADLEMSNPNMALGQGAVLENLSYIAAP